VPVAYSLSQNHPNPFNPRTAIDFTLPARSDVSITIFNILGQKIKTLVEKSLPAGNYGIIWDGTDYRGQSVSSGIYLYHMRAGEFNQTRKMLLIK
jgi:flagellar hook assembly protein FlgD